MTNISGAQFPDGLGDEFYPLNTLPRGLLLKPRDSHQAPHFILQLPPPSDPSIFVSDPVRLTEEGRKQASSSTHSAPGSVWGFSHLKVFHFIPNITVRQVTLGTFLSMRRLGLRHRRVFVQNHTELFPPCSILITENLENYHKVERRKKNYSKAITVYILGFMHI